MIKIIPKGKLDKFLEVLVTIIFILVLLSCFGGPNFDNMPYGDDVPIEVYR